MTIGYDNHQAQRWSTNANTYTLASYAVSGSISNRILVVLASFMRTNESGVPVTGITWNGQALTEAINSTGTSSSRSYYAGIWYLINPSAATGDLVASLGATMGGAILSAITLYDAAQTDVIVDTDAISITSNAESYYAAAIAGGIDAHVALAVSNAANNPTWSWSSTYGEHGELYDLNEGSSTTGEIAGSGAFCPAPSGYVGIGFTCSVTPVRTVGVAAQFKGLGAAVGAARKLAHTRLTSRVGGVLA